jgi:filamentation induced by cAMP protein fic
MCATNARSEIEKYAENFASELLMPTAELKKQAQKYAKDGYVDLDGVLLIADYFGASFLSCLYKIAYRLHMIQGDTDAETLQKLARKYKPAVKRKEQGKYDTVLYEQLFDAIGDNFKLKPTEYACQKFKTEYVFHDSRLEGIDIDMEMAAAIVMDLRFHKQDSPYCREENQNIVEVAGLTFAYDYAFREAESEICIYDVKHLNEQLFSTAPCSEYGGRYRESNTLVLGAKFETIDYRKIPEEMYFLDKEIKTLMDEYEELPLSKYVERVIQIHHRMTVIHAFRDGNGRTTRAFANMLLLKRNVSPVFFRDKEKDEYKEALKVADLSGQYDMLYERFFKSILSSFGALSDFRM